MTLKTCFVCFLFTCLFFEHSVCVAQEIKLKDVTRIELVSSAPWWNGIHYRRSEIIFENNKWNCYQDRLMQDSTDQRALKLEKKIKIINIRDSIRKFLRVIPVKDLQQMLTYINKPDTVLKFEQFNVTTKQLKQWVDTLQLHEKLGLNKYSKKEDSIKANLTAEQKAYFFRVIDSKQAVEDAGLDVLRPFMDDDRSYYGIILTFKDNHKDTISAYVNSFHPYHLPWKIKNKRSYNPHLSELFESFIGNEDFIANQKNSFVESIDWQLRQKAVLTKIYWDDYKKQHSSNYKTLSKTLSPEYMYDWNSGLFRSSLLPFNIELQFGLGFGDTLKTDYYNILEKETVEIHNRGNFLFDYLKDHPTYIAWVKGTSPKTIEQVKVTYPEIEKYDYRQIEFINIAVNYYQGWDINRRSGWLLLPDGKVILIYCNDQLIKDGDKIFAGLTLTTKNNFRYYCIVFNKQGQKIAGGESPVKMVD